MAEDLKSVIERLKASRMKSQAPLPEAPKPVVKQPSPPAVVEESDDDEDDYSDETPEETQQLQQVAQVPRKAITAPVQPREQPKEAVKREVEQPRAEPEPSFQELSREQKLLREIEMLQNDGRFRVELLYQLQEINKALVVIAGVFVDLSGNGKATG